MNTPAFPTLYPIVDASYCAGRGIEPVALAAACFEGGARILQLRVKEGTSAAFLTLAEAVVASARVHDARVIVNDRIDIALMAGADGLHVGQDDMTVADARRLMGAAMMLGVSTHTRAQIDAALVEPATYLAAGPVFGTTTKQTGYAATGLELIRCAANRGMPVVAIGGVTLERAPLALEAGAAAVAVISDLLATGDPAARVRDYLRALGTPANGTR